MLIIVVAVEFREWAGDRSTYDEDKNIAKELREFRIYR